MSRGRRHEEAAQAARRLAARVGRPAPERADRAPVVDDTPPGGWFVPASERAAGAYPTERPAPDDVATDDWDGDVGGDPDDAVVDAADDFDWFRPSARRRGASAGPGRVERWRELAADRVPVSLRGAARVPLTGAVAVLVLALAVVGGVLLRTASADAEVVDVPSARTRSQAVAQVGGSGSGATGSSALPVGAGVGAGAAGDGAAGPTVGSQAGAGAAGPSTGAAAGPTAGAGAAAGPGVVVDVVGRVRRPGLVRLPPGSRVADAVAAAGGPTDAAVLSRINLARLLVDGEQVVVPDRDDPLPAAPVAPAGGGTAPAAGATSSGPLDLNAATAADLDGLPGVGPVIAGRIVAWRAEHQRFSSVDELAEVDGIGPKLLERLRPLVRV